MLKPTTYSVLMEMGLLSIVDSIKPLIWEMWSTEDQLGMEQQSLIKL